MNGQAERPCVTGAHLAHAPAPVEGGCRQAGRWARRNADACGTRRACCSIKLRLWLRRYAVIRGWSFGHCGCARDRGQAPCAWRPCSAAAWVPKLPGSKRRARKCARRGCQGCWGPAPLARLRARLCACCSGRRSSRGCRRYAAARCCDAFSGGGAAFQDISSLALCSATDSHHVRGVCVSGGQGMRACVRCTARAISDAAADSVSASTLRCCPVHEQQAAIGIRCACAGALALQARSCAGPCKNAWPHLNIYSESDVLSQQV